MAASSASRTPLNSGAADLGNDLIREIRGHEVAIAELSALHSSRPVYQKNGNLFFRTTIEKATTSEQKKVDQAKTKLQKLNMA